MKFDIIIGNPPYQEMTGGGKNGGSVIYHKFIEASITLSDNVCMIVKNNWMNSGSLKDTRNKMIEYGLRTVVNYSLLGDAFPGMGIAASIIYIDGDNKNKGYINYTEIVKNEIVEKYTSTLEKMKKLRYIPTSEMEINIVDKVVSLTENYFGDCVILSPFGINTNGKISNGEYIDQSEIETDDYNIAIKYIDDVKYTTRENINKNVDKIDKYKVICPKQIHKTNNPIPSVYGLMPGQICSASFSNMFYSDNKEEAYNVYKYIKTKFFRYLVHCLSDSLCGMSSYRTSLVPNQRFVGNSDINWSEDISNIDKQLYKKYKLNQDEINYIESTIKQMN